MARVAGQRTPINSARMENAAPGTGLSKANVILIVSAWIVLLTLTHWGDRSPYSYGWAIFTDSPGNAERISGAVVNTDVRLIRPVTQFFYTAAPMDWASQVAQNMTLPLHAFTASIGMGLTRSFLLGNYLVNVVFAILLAIAAVNFAERYAIPRAVTLVTLLTVFSLPMYLDYLGQPLHYIVCISASFLVILAIVANDERSPWVLGLAVALLFLNYDPYVFLAALLAYVLFVVRFRSVRDFAIFALAAAAPAALWRLCLRFLSGGTMTRHLRRLFIEPVLWGWREVIETPFDNLIQPYVSTHIGAYVAVNHVLVMIYWPLIAVCAFLLIRLRPRLSTAFVLIALLPLFHLLEQLAAAAWDWELNPRRAIPTMLAFAVAWAWCAVRVWQQRGWRIAFVALMVMSMFLAMADTLLKEPVLAYMRTGQAMKLPPDRAIQLENLRLTKAGMTKLMLNEKIVWRDTGRARVERWGAFAIAQAGGLFLLVGLFWLCGRAALLPRWSAPVAAGVWAASLAMRFV